MNVQEKQALALRYSRLRDEVSALDSARLVFEAVLKEKRVELEVVEGLLKGFNEAGKK